MEKTNQEKSEGKLLAFAHDIILATNKYDDGEVYQIVESYIGKESIIKYKHSKNIELNEDEIEYLVNKLK